MNEESNPLATSRSDITNEPTHAHSSRKLLFHLFRFLLGLLVCFWLWAKWLFSPQLFYLPPLPPVEVLITLVESVVGKAAVALIPLVGLLLIFLDAWGYRHENPKWWRGTLLRRAVEVVAIHLSLCLAGTLVFFGIFALAPGSEVWGKGFFAAEVQGLLLFTSFLALIMAGPVTGLAVVVRGLLLRSRTGYPPTIWQALNSDVGAILLILLLLWAAGVAAGWGIRWT